MKCFAQNNPADTTITLKNFNHVSEKLKLYPNPAVSWLFVNHPLSKEKNTQIRVYDFNGVLLMTVYVKPDTEQTIINTGRLNPGNYLLNYSNGKETGTIKFKKE
ncbi:MAG: T9SS type A sorting domain-containing protein [Chitinophagaceae bacterium]|nr:T9SS type A sorting domain-containing protein [Chitinophagaceae bacterium]